MVDVHCVVGGQFGSEGKGAFTYALTKKVRDSGYDPLVVRTGGPNAGHTAWRDGREWKLRMIPAGMLVDDDVRGAIAAGAEIDEEVLLKEINDLETAGIPIRDRLVVDPSATLIEPHHMVRETILTESIGSTGKGVGAARSDRIMRIAQTYGGKGVHVLDVVGSCVQTGDPIIIEGTQGYGLGLHTSFYPKCTSRDVRSCDLLAEVGIPPTFSFQVRTWVVLRPNPIRVAGPSGPLSDETSWEALGLPVERTTVTNKVRRVGAWDPALAQQAIRANGGRSAVAVLMFADYVFPELAGKQSWADVVAIPDALRFVEHIGDQIGTHIGALGTSPSTVIWRFDASDQRH